MAITAEIIELGKAKVVRAFEAHAPMLDVEIGRDSAGYDVARIFDVVGVDAVAKRVGVIGAGPAGAGFMHVIGGDQEAQFVARLPQYLRASRSIVFGFGNANVAHRADILVITVMRQREARQADRNRVANRDVEHPADDLLVVITIFAFDLGIPHAKPRLPCDDVDRSGSGVAAADRALRTDIHFNPLNVEKGRSDARRTRQINAVPMGRRGRVAELGIVARPDAANPHFAIDAIVGDGEARKHIVQIRNILDAAFLEVIAREGRGRARITLQSLYPAVRSDDDLVLVLVLGRRVDRLLDGPFDLVGRGRRGVLRQRHGWHQKCAERYA